MNLLQKTNAYNNKPIMNIKSQAKIVGYNINSEAICASAARISTTQGNAFEIFEKAKNNPQNQGLIKKVLQSGHKSLIEHAVFTIAFCNVSAFVEQFLIECRLASFTIKSRRYVDFGTLGYYVPPCLSGDDLAHYKKYMDMLFNAYQVLLEQGIAKEDARFLLPYSFYSNLYCTMNARELVHLIRAIKHGRGREFPELNSLAIQIAEQVEELFPSLLPEIKSTPENWCAQEPMRAFCDNQNQVSFIQGKEIGMVELINSPKDPIGLLKKASHIACPALSQQFDAHSLFNDERPRELEQLSYSFLISNITLSGITHIVRHRMQSIIIPSIKGIDHTKHIVPATVANNSILLKKYKDTLATTNDMVRQINGNSLLNKYSYYYALSGNVMDIMTTINARELMLFIQLRACRRAQWEIRDISVEMLKQLRKHCPELFINFGPSCYAKKRCPEGKLSCGQMSEVVSKFKHSL